MEKLSICRICLVENVRMYVVVNRSMHELYEKLTDIPFVTEDSRPILACFFCCNKLKQCCRLLRQCLEAEELFAQMMNEDYEPSHTINQDRLEFYGGFIQSPIEPICVVDGCQTRIIAIKEELPAVCEGLDDIIELKEENQSDVTSEQEPENFDNSSLYVADYPPLHYSESDLEDNVPLMEFTIEVEVEEEEEEVAFKKQRSRETKREIVAKKPKLDTRRTKLEDAITAEQPKKEKFDSKVMQTTQKCTSKLGTYVKEPYKCDKRSLNQVKNMLQHTRIEIGEKPYKCDVCHRSFSQQRHLRNHIRSHTGEYRHKCNICQRSFSQKTNLINHIRIHTGEKPYKCDVCQRSFSQHGHLSNHILIHTGEKPYKCDVCQRSFSRNSDLTRHIRVHTGEKPC